MSVSTWGGSGARVVYAQGTTALEVAQALAALVQEGTETLISVQWIPPGDWPERFEGALVQL